MDDTNFPGPQPDFNVLSQNFDSAADSLRSASNEIKKAQNLPSITAGEKILVELQQMRRETREKLDRLDQNIAGIRQELAATRQDLITMMTTSNHNNAARVQNTYVSTRLEPLSPFLNISNGAPILEFPATSADIGQMTRQQVDAVLQQLALQPAHGANLLTRKKMLRGHIGLREIAQVPP